MKFFDITSLEDAKQKIFEIFKEFIRDYEKETELVDILDCYGRHLAEDIVSKEDLPSYNRSTVDGYAVVSSCTIGATETMPSLFTIVGKIEIGEGWQKNVKPGEAVYVPTGAFVPDGADCVVMVEHTELLDEKTLAVFSPTASGKNINFKGDDIKIGTKILLKGKRLDFSDVGILAAFGHYKIKVFRKPRIYIISTGNEIRNDDIRSDSNRNNVVNGLIDSESEKSDFRVRDINTYTLSVLSEKSGGLVSGTILVNDDIDKIRSAVEEGLKKSDIVLISGGSSVGIMDYTMDVLNSFEGKGVFIKGVAIKPGKPTIVAECERKAVFGLPGHPASAIIVYTALVEEFIRNLVRGSEQTIKIKAKLISNIHSSPGKTTYQLVALIENETEYWAKPLYSKSGYISTFSKADGYIVLNENEEGKNEGEMADVFLF